MTLPPNKQGLFEKDGITLWDGRNSRDGMDYGVRYEEITFEELARRRAEGFSKEFERMLLESMKQAWRAGYEKGLEANGTSSD